MNRKGMLITFEGIDYAGKTTQITKLCHTLQEHGYSVTIVREPGGTTVSEEIRKILLNPDFSSLHPYTELLLYSAARAQLVQEVILPDLTKGNIVLCDRYADSTTVYQGFSRGIDEEYIRCVNSIATEKLIPDLTFIMDISVEESMKRQDINEADRLERESPDFKKKIREGFLKLAREHSERCVVVNAMLSRESVAKEIWQIVSQKLIELNYESD